MKLFPSSTKLSTCYLVSPRALIVSQTRQRQVLFSCWMLLPTAPPRCNERELIRKVLTCYSAATGRSYDVISQPKRSLIKMLEAEKRGQDSTNSGATNNYKRLVICSGQHHVHLPKKRRVIEVIRFVFISYHITAFYRTCYDTVEHKKKCMWGKIINFYKKNTIMYTTTPPL